MNKKLLKNKALELAKLCQKAAEQGDNIVVTGHDMPDHDSIISAIMLQELLSRLGVESSVKFGTRPDDVTWRGLVELGLDGGVSFDGFDESDVLVLVDHHVCFYKNHVLGCVDHHTTPPTPDFEFSLIVPTSSCGRMIFDMASACEIADDHMERLAIYSVYLDTQSCRSPKFDKNDIPWLKGGIARLGIDEARLVKLGFCLCDPCEELETLAMYAYKRYEFSGKIGASGCVQIDVDEERKWDELMPSLISHIATKMQKEGIFLWALVVNKPEISRSDIYFILPGGQYKAVRLDRLASRSRDVVPVVEANAKQL